MSQIKIYKHLKSNGLIVSEDLIKDNSSYWFTDAQYLEMNHSQRSSIRYQLIGLGNRDKANQLKNLHLKNN